MPRIASPAEASTQVPPPGREASESGSPASAGGEGRPRSVGELDLMQAAPAPCHPASSGEILSVMDTELRHSRGVCDTSWSRSPSPVDSVREHAGVCPVARGVRRPRIRKDRRPVEDPEDGLSVGSELGWPDVPEAAFWTDRTWWRRAGSASIAIWGAAAVAMVAGIVAARALGPDGYGSVVRGDRRRHPDRDSPRPEPGAGGRPLRLSRAHGEGLRRACDRCCGSRSRWTWGSAWQSGR